MVIQLANGNLQFISTTPASSIARADFKPLLQTGEQRLARLAHVPLAREVGLPVPLMGSAVGLYAPKGLPAEVSKTLKDACAKAVQHPAMKNAADTTGTPLLYRDSAAYTDLIMAENREVGVLLERLGTESK
jgi:tripartite-type tricarboxylate transporter receptor subunit TctC